jgi:ABC-2 type transport system ATP-binding protein
VEVQASGLPMTDELRRDLQAVLERHGGHLESYGHPTTTLEDLFLHIVKESKAHPGRRFRPGDDAAAAAFAPEPPDGAPSTRIKEGKPGR